MKKGRFKNEKINAPLHFCFWKNFYEKLIMKEIITKLNKKFDNKTRLGIMSLLMVNEWVEFKFLKEMLGVSDGNLASHIKTLEAAKYLRVKKEFVGKKPKTSYAVTAAGKKAFNNHLDALEALLNRR